METLDKISEVLTSEEDLCDQIDQIDRELHALLMMGANDEKLVEKKRRLLKELYINFKSY